MRLVTEHLRNCWVAVKHAARELHIVFRFAAILPVNRWVAFRQRGSHPKGLVVQVRANQPVKMAFPGASARTLSRSDLLLDQLEDLQR